MAAILESPPDRVVYEEVRRHLGVDAAHLYGAFQAILLEECERRGLPCEAIPVSHIKKHATGKGNAAKDLVLAAARAKWPTVHIQDDNQADALWLWDLAQSRLKPQPRGD